MFTARVCESKDKVTNHDLRWLATLSSSNLGSAGTEVADSENEDGSEVLSSEEPLNSNLMKK